MVLQIGSFFMINLCLVVIATQFSETKKREMERMRQERQRAGSSSTISMSESADCYTQIIKYLTHLARRAKRITKRWYRRRRRQRKIKKRVSVAPHSSMAGYEVDLIVSFLARTRNGACLIQSQFPHEVFFRYQTLIQLFFFLI